MDYTHELSNKIESVGDIYFQFYLCRQKRENLIIATKVRAKVSDDPNGIGLSRKHIMDGIEQSLKRLQTNYVDLYQVC